MDHWNAKVKRSGGCKDGGSGSQALLLKMRMRFEQDRLLIDDGAEEFQQR